VHLSNLSANGSTHDSHAPAASPPLTEVAQIELPTSFGFFSARAFETASGFVYLALVAGSVDGERSVLTRVHSECLTGDVLGSLRCDCGIQLGNSLRAISAEGRGVLVYATGHEGRGVGLINKLRAYMQQDLGSDTVDANLHLGLPIDNRDYIDAAAVLHRLGVQSIRLITNNPSKRSGLEEGGIRVESVQGLPIAAHMRNVRYLETKQRRLGHVEAVGRRLLEVMSAPADVGRLLGRPRPRTDRPYVAIKYAQTLDGRIATATGDSKWISSPEERALSHALRARCDGIMVGSETVLHDNPLLTVRLVAGASPTRVVLDSTLRVPLDAHVFNDDAPTIVIASEGFDPAKVAELRSHQVAVWPVPQGRGGVDLGEALAVLRKLGIQSLLVEGGGRVITSLLSYDLADRMIVSIAPRVMGQGIEGVGDLGTASVGHSVELDDRCIQLVGEDVVMAWDVHSRTAGTP
jgi:GTP cyclohydrolase II